MSCSSTRSRTKKCRRSMCLERWWCSGLYAKSIADLLSMDKDVGSSGPRPRSVNRDRRYIASCAASEAAIISASQKDKKTEGCFFDDHEIAARLYMNT
eukprot:5635540-Pleurochrysis_carterae.AAC.1